jgi:hypothetical protein
MVRSTNHMGYARIEVINHNRQVIDRRAVGTRHDQVVHQAVLEGALAADDIAHHGGPLVGHPEPHGALALVLTAEPAVAVLGLPGGHLLGPGGRAVGVPLGQQALDRLGVPVLLPGLEHGVAVVVELEPVQGLEDPLDVLRRRAPAVGVLDAQQELAAPSPREQPVVECGPRAADVEGARRRRSEAHPHGHRMPLERRVQSRC